MTLQAKATSASEHVVALYHRGSSSPAIHFAITEHCEDTLRERIVVGEGVMDEDFWRWSSQLARGLVDIHSVGIIHLGITPDTIRLASETCRSSEG